MISTDDFGSSPSSSSKHVKQTTGAMPTIRKIRLIVNPPNLMSNKTILNNPPNIKDSKGKGKMDDSVFQPSACLKNEIATNRRSMPNRTHFKAIKKIGRKSKSFSSASVPPVQVPVRHKMTSRILMKKASFCGLRGRITKSTKQSFYKIRIANRTAKRPRPCRMSRNTIKVLRSSQFLQKVKNTSATVFVPWARVHLEIRNPPATSTARPPLMSTTRFNSRKDCAPNMQPTSSSSSSYRSQSTSNATNNSFSTSTTRSEIVNRMAQIQSQIPNSNAYGLYLGVKIVDTIANKVEIRQEALELLGAAALWVGMKSHISFGCSIKISKLARVVQISEAKLVEAVQEIEHLVNVSELANARDSLSYMEQQFAEDVILKDLRVSWWLSRRKSQAEKLGWYLCETSLLDLRTGAFQTTEIGASATFLARYLLDRGTSWTEQDERILGVAWRAVEDCSKLMVDIAVNQPHAGILERHQLSVKVVGALKSLRAAF